MAAARATGSSSRNILADLKSPELFKQVIELDHEALQSIGCYRAAYEKKKFSEQESDVFIPYKWAPIKKSYFIAAALFFISYFVGASIKSKKLDESTVDYLFFPLFIMGILTPFVGLIQRGNVTVNNNQFHKRMKPEKQIKFKAEAQTYLYQRATFFVQCPEFSTDTHKAISQEISYELLRLLVDCYRMIDENQPNLLEITNMIDKDFIYHPNLSRDGIALKGEYNDLRIEKRQHLRY